MATTAPAPVHPHHAYVDPEAAEVWVGSHYDTVHDAGKYDGALGIVAGIAAVKAVLLEVRLGMPGSSVQQCVAAGKCGLLGCVP